MSRLASATALGSGLVLVAGVTLIALSAMSPSGQRQTATLASVRGMAPTTDIPAVDARVPERIETATFALG